MPKTRLTGFSRLVIFLLIFLPLAYFGASWYNGEDPVAKIKGFFGGETEASAGEYNNHRPDGTAYDPTTAGEASTNAEIGNLRKEVKYLKAQIAVAEEKLARCQANSVE